MFRGGKHTAAAIVRLNFLFQQVGGNEVDTLHTVEGVHLVDFRLQVLLEPLREATRDVQFLDFALLAHGVDGFLLRIADEAAGINNDNIRLPIGVVANRVAMFQQSGQMLRVDFVFGATEGDNI